MAITRTLTTVTKVSLGAFRQLRCECPVGKSQQVNFNVGIWELKLFPVETPGENEIFLLQTLHPGATETN